MEENLNNRKMKRSDRRIVKREKKHFLFSPYKIYSVVNSEHYIGMRVGPLWRKSQSGGYFFLENYFCSIKAPNAETQPLFPLGKPTPSISSK